MRSFVFLKVSRTSPNCVHGGPPLTLHTQLGVSCPLKKRYPQKNFDQKTHATHEREGERRSSQNYFLKGDTFFEFLFASWSEFVRFYELFSRVEPVIFDMLKCLGSEKISYLWSHHKYAYVILGHFGVPFSSETYLAPRGEVSSSRYPSW